MKELTAAGATTVQIGQPQTDLREVNAASLPADRHARRRHAVAGEPPPHRVGPRSGEAGGVFRSVRDGYGPGLHDEIERRSVQGVGAGLQDGLGLSIKGRRAGGEGNGRAAADPHSGVLGRRSSPRDEPDRFARVRGEGQRGGGHAHRGDEMGGEHAMTGDHDVRIALFPAAPRAPAFAVDRGLPLGSSFGPHTTQLFPQPFTDAAMPDHPTEQAEAELDDLSLSLLPQGRRHVRMEHVHPDGRPDDHRIDLDAEALINAVSDRIADVAFRRTDAADVALLLLDRSGRTLGSITARADFLRRRGAVWGGDRHIEGLIRTLAFYVTIDQVRLLEQAERALVRRSPPMGEHVGRRKIADS